MNAIKRFLILEWEAIAGILAAVAAIVMHFLHLVESDVLLTISVVLIAVLFIRDLRREGLRERLDSSLQRTEAGIKELQLTIGLVIEHTKLLDDILERLQAPGVDTYPSREALYSVVPEIIASVSTGPNEEKQLLLAALHGHSGRRILIPAAPIPVLEAFDTALLNCIMSSGLGMWAVREIYNITAEDRLNLILERLEQTKDADGYQVRTFSFPDAVAPLSPLVIGSEHVFLALDDPRYYRVSKAFHVKNREVANLVKEYFDSLWNDSRAVTLRSAVGIETDGVHALREILRGSQPAHETAGNI